MKRKTIGNSSNRKILITILVVFIATSLTMHLKIASSNAKDVNSQIIPKGIVYFKIKRKMMKRKRRRNS